MVARLPTRSNGSDLAGTLRRLFVTSFVRDAPDRELCSDEERTRSKGHAVRRAIGKRREYARRCRRRIGMRDDVHVFRKRSDKEIAVRSHRKFARARHRCDSRNRETRRHRQ